MEDNSTTADPNALGLGLGGVLDTLTNAATDAAKVYNAVSAGAAKPASALVKPSTTTTGDVWYKNPGVWVGGIVVLLVGWFVFKD